MDNENIDKEFRVLSLSIEKFSLFYGGFLILWGVIVSLISESTSLTSFIPSFLGLPLVIFSFLAIKFTSKKKTIYAYCCDFWTSYIFGRIRCNKIFSKWYCF